MMTASDTLAFRCDCGAIEGAFTGVKPGDGMRYACHCDDCQAFAEFLGRADDLLDARGGTECFNIAASKLSFTKGRDNIACVRMTAKPTLRFFCGQCRTPIAGCLADPRLSFMTCQVAGFDPARRDEVMGPFGGHVNTGYAYGGPGGLSPFPVWKIALRAIGRVAMARLSGDWRRSPFFNPATLEPVSAPTQVSPRDRARLDAAAAERAATSARP